MLDRWFGPKTHHYLHILGMMILTFGLPFNKVLMSIGSIWGVANVLLEGNFRTYYQNIKKNKAFLFLLGFFILHLVALLWTSNFEYAFHDLRIKLPILAVPLALVAHPIVLKKEIHLLLITFLSSLLLISVVNGINYLQMSDMEIGNNFREISVFGSHIRFSILIVIGLIIAGYFVVVLRRWRLFFISLMLWFLYYTYISQVLSGPLSILVMGVFAFIYWIWPKKLIRYSVLSACIASFGFAVISVQKVQDHKRYDFSNLDTFSIHNNRYYHDTLNPSVENGKPIYIYICYDEIANDWSDYFSVPYDGVDKKGNAIQWTFLRYMTALDLKKDREGLKKLDKKDIRNIENGIATPDHLQKGFTGRFAAIKYALENQDDPNNSTILQRIEYWKTADQIIMNHPIIGVGTGDVQDAFNAQYEENKSKLIPSNRLRAHNMFLTIQLTFGILGTLVILFFIGSFLRFNRGVQNLFAFCVFGAIIASFLVEDTLETQTGVTLFSFFIGLFLVDWQKNKVKSS